MTAPQRLEQDLPRLLAQLADGSRPDYRDSLVRAVGRTRQRPAWTFPGRWLAMDLVTERVAPRAPLRVPIALLIVLALVAAGLVALAVASRRDVPNPFGPAGNGEVLYVVDGTIYTLDPTDMGSHPFLADGSGSDHGPVFSLDGAHVAFARSTNDGDTVYVAAANGTGARPVTDPLVGLTSYAWSPDGRSLAVAARGHGYPQVFLVAMDGSGSTALDIGVPTEDPVWRPPNGGPLLVRAQLDSGRELLLVDVASGTIHQLPIEHIEGGATGYDGQRASWSPDGGRLVYEQGQASTGTLGVQAIRLRVADVTADGRFSSDRLLELDARSDSEYLGRWLPTGDRLAFAQQVGCTWQVWVAPDADTRRATPVGEPFEDCTNEGIEYELSPDGTRVMTIRGTAETLDPIWISNTDGSDRAAMPIRTSDLLSWQRMPAP
jgi:Tol biopolymer transport system component